jgi:RNA polymerase sigma-70 factor (ECF subfamily)
MEQIADLVIKARSGDAYAQEQLYIQTKDKAYYLALQLLKNSQDAEDVLHDAYIKAFSKIDDAIPEKFGGWLDTIVINRAKDIMKKKKPMAFAELRSDEGKDFEPLDEEQRIEFLPQDNLDYQETKYLIQEIIDELPTEQRTSVILYYYKEMSVGQIAEYFECSTGTIKSRLNYARKTIKAKVEELENKGTKLYCFPLLPFLYWMFRSEAKKAIFAPTSILQEIGQLEDSSEIAKELVGSNTASIEKSVVTKATKGLVAKVSALSMGVKMGTIVILVSVGIVGVATVYHTSVNKSHSEIAVDVRDTDIADIAEITENATEQFGSFEDSDKLESFKVGTYTSSDKNIGQWLNIIDVTDKEVVFTISCSSQSGHVGLIEEKAASKIDKNIANYSTVETEQDFQLKFECKRDGTIEVSEVFGEGVFANPYCGMYVYMSGIYSLENDYFFENESDIETVDLDSNYSKIVDTGFRGNLWISNISKIEESKNYFIITTDVYSPQFLMQFEYDHISEDYETGKYFMITQRLLDEHYAFKKNNTGKYEYSYILTKKNFSEEENEVEDNNDKVIYYINNVDKQADSKITDYYDISDGFHYINPKDRYYIMDIDNHPLYVLMESQISLKISKFAEIKMINPDTEEYQKYNLLDCINSAVTGQQGQAFIDSSGQIVFNEKGEIIRFYEDYYE